MAAQAGLAECTEVRNRPTRISFLTLCAKLALFDGDYARFEELVGEIYDESDTPEPEAAQSCGFADHREAVNG